MGILQKAGFAVGLLLAVVVTVPLIQSVEPEDEELLGASDEQAVTETLEDTHVIGADEANPIIDPDSEALPSAEAPQQMPDVSVATVTQAEGEASTEASTETEPRSPSSSVAQESLVNQQTADSTEQSPQLDRLLGPFASEGRAKRFAATFSDETKLAIQTLNQSSEGWYIAVAYRDSEQRHRQRQAMVSATGLELLPMD